MAKTPLSTLYNHIKTLIKQFTYLKSEIDTALSLKIDTPGTGLSKNGTTLNHSNSITAQNSNVFKKFKYDGQGHITGTANVSASDLPSNIPTSKISGLSAVATSNDYGDLDNKPSIPSKTSDLTNDSGYLTQHQDISGKEDKTNKTSSWNSTTNNTRYPTEKLVKDSLDGKSDNGHTHSQYLTSHQDISGKSDINHGHGNITKDGVITGQASKNVVTDSNGKITTENKYVHPSNHPTSIIKEASALANIGTSADANQHEVNDAINTALNGKANTSHSHDDRYYTESEIDTKLNGKANTNHTHDYSKVSVNPTKTSGVEIGRITVDGTEKILYQQDNNTTYTPAAATPTADTSSGAVGTSAKYAREDHVHPKSSLYAEASHTHSYAASNHNHSGTYVDGAGTKNTIDGSAIAEIKANTTVKGTIYHPKVNSSALTGVPTADATIAFGGNFSVSQPSVNTDGHVTGLTSRKITLPSLGTTATTACAGNDSRLSNSRVPVFTKIPATSSNEVSLNTYKTGGFYYIDSDSNAKYIDKCPTAKASNTSFFLLVETWGTSSNYIKQTLTYYNTNKTYVRTKAGNSNADTNWKDWVEISKDTDTTYSAEKGITLSSGKFGHSNTAITAQSTSGLYKITYDAYGHITGATAVDKADITGLGIPGSDTNTTYSADNSTLQLSSNQFSVKDKGITNAKIADGTIESGKIKDGTIVNADIASNAAIAYSKLSGVAASSHTHSKSNISDWGKWQRVGSWGTSSGWNQTVYCNGMFVYVIIKTGTYSINSTTWVNAGSLQADAAYRPPNIFYVGSNNDVVVKLNPDGTIQLASYSGTKSTYGAGNFIYPYDLSNNLE